MTVHLNQVMAREHVADLLRAAQESRVARAASPSPRRRARGRAAAGPRLAQSPAVTMYVSDVDATVERLAQLDSAPRPSGPVLVAAIDGRMLAALPLSGGPAIADPFAHTAELVALLELRRAQLDGRRRARTRCGRVAVTLLRRARQAAATAAGA